MNISNYAIKRTALATAMTAALGISALPEQASARQLEFTYTGWFTMINAGGTDALVNGDASGNTMFGRRTGIQGTMIFDDASNSGSMTMDGFSFFGSGDAVANNISFVDADGIGGAGTEVLGNLTFTWNSTVDIPVSLQWDFEGLLNANPAALTTPGQIIGASGPGAAGDFFCATPGSGTTIACATPATDAFSFNFGKNSYTLPIGPVPIVTTTFNTTTVPGSGLGTALSGTLPFVADVIAGGSPMIAGPFPGFNANFDIVNLVLTNTGGVDDITAPPDVNDIVPEAPPPTPPRTENVSLGTPTDVSPPGTAEYCLTGVADCDLNVWIPNGANIISVPVVQTINTLTVDWRSGGGAAIDSQEVTVTVNDLTPPDIDTSPIDFSVDVDSVTDQVCFTGDTIPSGSLGYLTASDVWDASPTIEYSLDGFTFFPSNPSPGQDCSSDFPPGTSFGPDVNTVTWRATDTAGNNATIDQTVTLNLPTGIIGKPCEIDLDYVGLRNTAGDFIMRQPDGGQTGTTDTGVTGVIDTTLLCTDPVCSDVGTTLEAGQPFQSLLWFAEPVFLYGPGDWQFNACTGTPGVDDTSDCAGPPQPRLLDMTVKTAVENNGVPQLGAHMLFEWGTTKGIDVVVVWDVDCGSQQLTTTDPDGDGILGTKMVDGPFIGFSAAFDVSATGLGPDPTDPNLPPIEVPLIADGGFVVSIPAFRNPTPKSSPLPLSATEQSADEFAVDPAATESCVGGCYSFSTDGVLDATDANGAYKYAQVVLPLNQPIPFWSLYRKFDDATNQWRPFALDARNDVKSAPFDAGGFCPEPGAGDYKVADTNSLLANKLQQGDNCIQLTIEDNGPNDSNAAVGTVDDPSGVAAVPAPPLPDPETNDEFWDGGSGGGCTISNTPVDPVKRADWWLLGGLLGWLGFRSLRKRSR